MANVWWYEQTKLLIALWSKDLDLSSSVLKSYPCYPCYLLASSMVIPPVLWYTLVKGTLLLYDFTTLDRVMKLK